MISESLKTNTTLTALDLGSDEIEVMKTNKQYKKKQIQNRKNKTKQKKRKERNIK